MMIQLPCYHVGYKPLQLPVARFDDQQPNIVCQIENVVAMNLKQSRIDYEGKLLQVCNINNFLSPFKPMYLHLPYRGYFRLPTDLLMLSEKIFKQIKKRFANAHFGAFF